MRKPCFLLALIVAMTVPFCAFGAEETATATTELQPGTVLNVDPDTGQKTVVGNTPTSGPIMRKEPRVLGQTEPASPTPEQTPQSYVDESLQLLMPLDQRAIEKYKTRASERERAISPSTPELKTRTVLVQLQPGTVPQTVHTTANIATSIVFHDSTGQAWPITSVTNGGSGFFQVLRPQVPEENLLNIVPLVDNVSASIVVSLEGKDLPIVIRLVSDHIQDVERKADAMVLFQVKAFGPNAAPPVITNIQDTVSSDMISILDQVTPPQAKRLKIEPSLEGYALFALNGKHYLRTSDMLQWPASMAVVNGAGGMKCYELPVTPSIMVSHQGKIIKLKIADIQGR